MSASQAESRRFESGHPLNWKLICINLEFTRSAIKITYDLGLINCKTCGPISLALLSWSSALRIKIAEVLKSPVSAYMQADSKKFTAFLKKIARFVWTSFILLIPQEMRVS